MPFDNAYEPSPRRAEPPSWTITIRGWKAYVMSYVCVFACVLGFVWMFLSVQQSIANLLWGCR